MNMCWGDGAVEWYDDNQLVVVVCSDSVGR